MRPVIFLYLLARGVANDLPRLSTAAFQTRDHADVRDGSAVDMEATPLGRIPEQAPNQPPDTTDLLRVAEGLGFKARTMEMSDRDKWSHIEKTPLFVPFGST